MYIVLILVLIILFLINGKVYKDNYFAPGGLYCAVLLISALYGCCWYKLWELDHYEIKTTAVILIGAFTFSCSGWILHIIFEKYPMGQITIDDGFIRISGWKIFIVYIIEIVTLVLAVNFYGGSLNNISNAIIQYRVAAVRGDASMPDYLSVLLSLSLVIGYTAGYFVVLNFLLKKKLSMEWAGILVLSILICLMAGSRGGSISILFVAVGLFYEIFRRNNLITIDYRRKRRIKILAIIAIIVGITFFIQSSYWIGRNMEYTSAYYFAIYLSAPLKNLDLYIKKIDAGVSANALGFTNLNGLSLGNVGTVYTSEYAAGGITAVIFFSVLLGLLFALIYEIVNKRKIHSGKIDLFLVLYAYLFYAVSMVSFGNTLIKSIFSLFFLKIVFGMIIFMLFYNSSFSVKTGKLMIKKVI